MTTIKSGDTVFSSLGFDAEQSENLRLRAELMIEIEAVLKERKLTQVGAAKLFGVSQPRVSNLLKGRIDKFSVDTLVNWLSKLDKHVELVVSNAA
jgi:predicted XRE-type DNA-binding protein